MATEPEVAPVWGETISASPDIVRPSDGFIQAGWPLTSIPPSRGFFNWVLKFASNAATYLLERGIPTWNTGRTYPLGAVVRDAADNTIYVATGNTTAGTHPSADLGNWRPIFDRAGFPIGRTIRWLEQWPSQNSNTANGTVLFVDLDTSRWNAVIATVLTGNNVISTSFDDGSSGFPGTGLSNVLRLKSTGANVSDSGRLTKSGDFKFTINRYAAMEFDVWAGTVPTQQQLFCGFGLGLPVAGFSGAYFFADGSGNWKAVCGDGTSLSSFVGTGVAVSSSAWQRLRIELIGASVNPAGGSNQAKFYIGGVLVATITSVLPVGQTIGTTFGFTKVASGGDLLSFVGPVQHARTY